MRADLVSKGRSLTGSSDLTLFAKLKPGLVPALDSLSYKTRTQRLLKLLQGGRVSLHEYAINRPLSDAVERVARIHSFRVTVVEPDNTVMLAVTFDGTWESYIRVLWQKVGSLLDIIFCNTQDYVLSTEGFEAWCGWVRRVQVETAFYFNTHGLTVDDVHWLRGAEAIARAEPQPERAALATVRHRLKTAEQIAWETGSTTTPAALDNLRQGLQSLALLFRMTDMYMPGTPDGAVLLRAARDLLMEFRPLVQDTDLVPELAHPIRNRFLRQLRWLNEAGPGEGAVPGTDGDRPLPTLPTTGPVRPDRPADVQAGMLRGYDNATHGCLALLAFDDAAAAAPLLERLAGNVSHEAGDPAGDGPFINAAFSFEGLRRIGVAEALLAALPGEFREGMEARASMLGDFRTNHPRRWRLPRRNWLPASPRLAEAGEPIAMAAVHAVVSLRARMPGKVPPGELAGVLHEALCGLLRGDGGQPLRGVSVLAVQPMHRLQRDGEATPTEHFGFADGKSQPVFEPEPAAKYNNQVHLGELLLGYPNEADFAPVATHPADAERLSLLHNGSFMVVRKLRQDVARWRGVVADAANATGLKPDLIGAKLMGRWKNGSSLINNPAAHGAGPDNDFNFDDDEHGTRCPLHSHVRRSNPRGPLRGLGEAPGARRPRIVRRGMSYGVPFEPGEKADKADRGLVFIAFNAQIAEQFEVIQRWLAGGNSTGGFSGHADPLLGVPEPGQTRHFRFETDQPVKDRPAGPCSVAVALDGSPPPFREAEPLVRLEWGAYLFCPSLSALRRLAQTARSLPAPAAAGCPWPLAEGRRRLHELQAASAAQAPAAAIATWKAALEDPQASEQLASAGLWAAVREQPHGVLRTPYGVLVADQALVMQVLADDSRYSVSGYRQRMVESGLDIYLGMDRHPLGDGSRYAQLSKDINATLGRLGREGPFKLAFGATAVWLKRFVDGEKAAAIGVGGQRWELNIDVKEIIDGVMTALCTAWFGVPDGKHLAHGSWRWDWTAAEPPLCPVHFTPPSRYFFQPHPGPEVRDWGTRTGAALAQALTKVVAGWRAAGAVPKGADGQPAPLAQAVFDALALEDDATVGRTLAGVMMGYLPTLDGNLRLVLNEWLRLGTFWSLRARWAADPEPDPLAKATALLEGPMRSAMQFKPTPELIWRTAVRDGERLGDVPIHAGDKIVLSLVSAAQQQLEAGRDDVYAIFGGQRHGADAAGVRGPTHACPAYDAALGAMLGALAGWVGAEGNLRASPAPLAFTIEGAV